ncbi:MAG: hypothetical protein QOJ39_2644 [Candidatus Eremiobacteraeota bacterium]|jgi:hypothetical protein|nr:hypothetical protein [Candidatus Eremiobacteraeota bacterium]
MRPRVLAIAAAAALVLTVISFSAPPPTRAQTAYGSVCLTIYTYDSYSVTQCISQPWSEFTIARDYCGNFSAHTMGPNHYNNFMTASGSWTDGGSIDWEGSFDMYQSEIGTCD